VLSINLTASSQHLNYFPNQINFEAIETHFRSFICSL